MSTPPGPPLFKNANFDSIWKRWLYELWTYVASLSITLPASGVTAGTYTNTDLTVNSQGIITAASNGSGGGSFGATSDAHYNEAVATGNLVAYYGLDETNPSISAAVVDRYAAQNAAHAGPYPAVAVNPCIKDGRFGLAFGGTNYYVGVIAPGYFMPTAAGGGSFTWECWFTAFPQAGNAHLLDTRGTGYLGSTPGIQVGYSLDDWKSNTIVDDGAGNTLQFSSLIFSAVDLAPHQAVFSWDDSSGTMRLVLDGIASATATNAALIGAAAANKFNSHHLTFGRAANGNFTAHEGTMDAVVIYNTVLTLTQIQALYTKGRTGI